MAEPPATNPSSSSKQAGRFRRFLNKIRSFLTRQQTARVEKEYAKISNQPIPKPQPANQAQPLPTPPKGAPPESRAGRAAAPPTAPTTENLAERARRIEELRLIEEEARLEREQIEEKVAAQAPPDKGIDSFPGERKGLNYNTWFKAFGTFGDLREMGDSPTLLGELEELEDMDVPAAFYSSGILGKVKWKGRRERTDLIEELNTVAPWSGQDFRDIYPKWEYVYKITESVGDVVVQEFTYKARRPYDQEAKRNGYKSR